MTAMKCSEAGLALIREFEGCRLEAYPDPATGGEPWTIGYGHTGNVYRNDVCTEKQAAEWLASDVGAAERCVNRCLAVPVIQGQFDALVSFVFNLGCGALTRSTLLSLLNSGNDDLAAAEFLRWNRANGQPMAGLTRRRQAEMEMFLA